MFIMSEFKQIDLKLVSPGFGSELTGTIMDLNYLKKREVYGSTKPIVSFQVKEIFHYLESLASARIEGNHTTLSGLVEAKLGEKKIDEKQREVFNINNALDFIDTHVESTPIDQEFIREVHRIIVMNLSTSDEGCITPGSYRFSQVYIAGTKHIPPNAINVKSHMAELSNFINHEDGEQFDLIKTALAHHRFVWIHPFENGNGRTVRMLTYAMLVKQGFNIDQHRILNPAAIFCNDREKYYAKLATADEGTDDAYLDWCQYVIEGLSVEINKIDKLLDYKYLSEQILFPALKFIEERNEVRPVQFKIASKLVKQQVAKSSELAMFIPDKSSAARFQILNRMVEKKILRKAEKRGCYALEMTEGPLLRGIVYSLKENGFVPKAINRD
jgi:Fic family protein